jgi:hypothetical protein
VVVVTGQREAAQAAGVAQQLAGSLERAAAMLLVLVLQQEGHGKRLGLERVVEPGRRLKPKPTLR